MLRCSFLILGDRWVTYHIGGSISLGHMFLFSHVVMLCVYFLSAYVSSAPISVDSDSFSSHSLFAMKWCSYLLFKSKAMSFQLLGSIMISYYPDTTFYNEVPAILE
jgi:hypothetical protein